MDCKDYFNLLSGFKGVRFLFGYRAHDTRSLSTSLDLFNGLSMEEIMVAASWKSESTITVHYLKFMSEERGRFA